jgi:hypothetical protein
MQEDKRKACTCIAETQPGTIGKIIATHTVGGYAPGTGGVSSGMPTHAARYAMPMMPLEKRNPTTVSMRTTMTSQPLACASPRQTPAIIRPARGRIRGLPGIGCVNDTAAPHLEQNRALACKELPHCWQNMAILVPPGSSPRLHDTNKHLQRFRIQLCAAPAQDPRYGLCRYFLAWSAREVAGPASIAAW